MATLDGAHVAGVEDRTGSLTPGKQADVVVIDATAINVGPIHDPAAAVTLSRRRVERRARAGRRRVRQARLQARRRRGAGDVAGAGLARPPRRRGRRGRRREAGDGARVTTDHLVARAADLAWSPPGGPLAGSPGLEQWSVVDASTAGRAHRLRPEPARAGRARCPSHVHSYEESLYVLDGQVVVQTPGEAARLGPGDYGLIPVGVPHSLRNEGDERGPVRAAVGAAAAARARPRHPAGAGAAARPSALAADVRDPRTRRYGHIERREHGPGAADAGPAGGVGQHAHGAARLQRDHA